MGSPTTGSHESRHGFGPKPLQPAGGQRGAICGAEHATTGCACRQCRRLVGPRAPSTRSRRPQGVASRGHENGRQNHSGRSLTKAKTAGSEPIGNKVAETRRSQRWPPKPTWGMDNQASKAVTRIQEMRHAGHCGRHAHEAPPILLATAACHHAQNRQTAHRQSHAGRLRHGRRNRLVGKGAQALGGQIGVGKTEHEELVSPATSGTKSLSLAMYRV